MSAVLLPQPKTRTNRQTGTDITVGRADVLFLDDADGDCRWYCVCETHNEIIGHSSKRLADYFAASPLDWCEGCRIDDAEGSTK